ncbi:MAG: hypothetical protein ACJAT4_000748 [Granulosicoccus sp.]|jgi:hypothetical protein
MQVRNFLHFLLITFYVLTFSQVVDAQQIEHNKEGEKIALFSDGKWEYFDKSNPIHLKIEEDKKRTQIAFPHDIFGEQASKGAANDFADEDDEERFERLLSKAEGKLALDLEREGDIKFSKILIEEEMEDLKTDENSTDEQYFLLKRQLKLASDLEKDAKKKIKKSKKELEKLKQQGEIVQQPTSKKSKKKKSKKNRKLNVKVKELQNSKYTYKEDGTFYLASKKFEKYSVDEDVMYNPPQKDCNLVFDGVDEFMGKTRKDVERDVLFTFTNNDMRRYMKADDYIACEGNLTQIKGGVLLLNLFISIHTTDGQRAFGGLTKGNLITLKMINGESINLVNNQSDNGFYDPLKKQHTFIGQFRINSGQEKALKKCEVDVVRIIWDAGFEDYEVYNLDFFINQFKCLN